MIEVSLLGAAIGCTRPEKTAAMLNDAAGFQAQGSWGDEVLLGLASDAVIGLAGTTTQPRIVALLGRIADADDAVGRLEATGVDAHLVAQGGHREVHLADADGLQVRLVELPDGLPDPTPSAPNGLRLHHVSIATLDLARSVAFYESHLGLRTVLSSPRPGEPSLVLMADSKFDPNVQNFVLEIIGPPHQPREIAAIARLGGACFDHFCATTNDVIAAHDDCVLAGCRTSEAPERVEEMGISLSYVFLPDDVEFELMDNLSPRIFS